MQQTLVGRAARPGLREEPAEPRQEPTFAERDATRIAHALAFIWRDVTRAGNGDVDMLVGLERPGARGGRIRYRDGSVLDVKLNPVTGLPTSGETSGGSGTEPGEDHPIGWKFR